MASWSFQLKGGHASGPPPPPPFIYAVSYTVTLLNVSTGVGPGNDARAGLDELGGGLLVRTACSDYDTTASDLDNRLDIAAFPYTVHGLYHK